jgi:hypothetical protein
MDWLKTDCSLIENLPLERLMKVILADGATGVHAPTRGSHPLDPRTIMDLLADYHNNLHKKRSYGPQQSQTTRVYRGYVNKCLIHKAAPVLARGGKPQDFLHCERKIRPWILYSKVQ